MSYNFSNARFSAEAFTDRYLGENNLAGSGSLAKEELYATTSYFDSFYSPNLSGSRAERFSIFVYVSLLPIVLAMTHATSLFLLWRFPKQAADSLQLTIGPTVRWLLCTTYGALVLACYTALYVGLRTIASKRPLP